MKKIYLKIVLLFSVLCFAQQNAPQKSIDSLLVVLKTKKQDTAKVNVYQQLYELSTNAEVAIKYRIQIGALSKKTNYKRGLGFYYLDTASESNFEGEAALANANKAATYFLEGNDFKYYLLAIYYIANSNNITTNKAISLINRAVKIGVKNRCYAEVANLYTTAGFLHYSLNNLKMALKYYKVALQYYNKASTKLQNSHALYSYLAFVNTDLGNYSESLVYLDLASSFGEASSSNMERARVLNKLFRHKEALAILLRNKSKKLLLGKPEENYNAFLTAQTYFYLKNYPKAIEILLTLQKEKCNRSVKIASENILASCYLVQQKFAAAKAVNEMALKLLPKCTNFEDTENTLKLKSEIDPAHGNLKSALVYFKKYNEAVAKHNEQINKDKIYQLEIDFKVTEKENKIKQLSLQQEKRKLELQKQYYYLFYIIFCFIVALGYVIFYIKTNRASNVKNQIIALKNTELEKSVVEKEDRKSVV